MGVPVGVMWSIPRGRSSPIDRRPRGLMGATNCTPTAFWTAAFSVSSSAAPSLSTRWIMPRRSGCRVKSRPRCGRMLFASCEAASLMAAASSSTCWRGKHSVEHLVRPVHLARGFDHRSGALVGVGPRVRAVLASLQRRRLVVLGCDFAGLLGLFPLLVRLYFLRCGLRGVGVRRRLGTKDSSGVVTARTGRRERSAKAESRFHNPLFCQEFRKLAVEDGLAPILTSFSSGARNQLVVS